MGGGGWGGITVAAVDERELLFANKLASQVR